jgi:hypothetical protein
VRQSVYDQIELRTTEARRAAHTAEQQRRAFVRSRAELASLSASLALVELQRALVRKYRPDQPRVPAGQTGAGRWTVGVGLGDVISAEGRPAGSARGDAPIVVAGGFEPDQLNLTAQALASRYCIGSIQAEIPGQFKDSTISDIMAAAKDGDAQARKCLKLLGREKYRK